MGTPVLVFLMWLDRHMERAEGSMDLFSFSSYFSIFSEFSVMITYTQALKKTESEVYCCYKGVRSTLFLNLFHKGFESNKPLIKENSCERALKVKMLLSKQ